MRSVALLLPCVFVIACSDEPIGKVGSAIKVEPLTIELGDTPIGTLKKFEVTISNIGAVTLAVSDFALVEETGVPFSLDLSAVGTKEAPFTLAPGEKTIVEVRHIPRDRVLDSGVLRISSDDPDNGKIEVTIDQTGSGAPELIVVPDVEQADVEADTPGGISTSTQEIAFGMVPVGVRRSIVTFAVNGGDGNIPLEITDIDIVDAVSAENLTLETEPDPAEGSVLLPILGVKSRASPLRSLKITLNWQPPASGAGLQATLRIASTDPTRPMLDIPITGGNTTVNSPSLRLVPPNGLTFAQTAIGQTGTGMFTAHNDGAADLVIAPITVINDTGNAFRHMGQQVTIQPGRSHTYSAQYVPQTGGTHSAALNIASNDPLQPSINYPLNGEAPMSCTPQTPDPGEPVNDDCMTAIDRGSFALDVDMQQSVDWTDSMLFATGDNDWNYVNLSVIAGCDACGYDLDANVILPAGEQAEVCMEIGDCGAPIRSVCGMNQTGVLLFPFLEGDEACYMFNNMLPVRVKVRHTSGEPTCTPYTLHFSAR